MLQAFSAIDFPLILLQLVFFFFNPGLFRSVLFRMQIFGYFPGIILLFISSLISLWSENKLCMTGNFENLLRLALWPRIWTILKIISMRAVWKVSMEYEIKSSHGI